MALGLVGRVLRLWFYDFGIVSGDFKVFETGVSRFLVEF